MAQRRKSQSPTVKNRDSVPPTPVLSFYQESGQSYRPFTDPKRIMTNDAKKSCGADPRVHFKGVPPEFLGIPPEFLGMMNTAETPTVSAESTHTIENQPQCKHPQAVFDSDCQQGTTNPNADSSLLINDGTLNLSPTPLRVDIPLILEGTYPMESGLSPLYSPGTSPPDPSDLSLKSFNNLTMPELFKGYHSLGENFSSRTSLVLPHGPSYVSGYSSEANLEMSDFPGPNGSLTPNMNIGLGCINFFPKPPEAGFPSYEDQFQSGSDSNFDYQLFFSSSEDPVVHIEHVRTWLI
ncbi:hypothetical protein M0805_004976 [Coniferiporia weirii]|nr:hypothetical protein M0805_004976 [Coniferiporia weirii]